jgi:hypothetical protein
MNNNQDTAASLASLEEDVNTAYESGETPCSCEWYTLAPNGQRLSACALTAAFIYRGEPVNDLTRLQPGTIRLFIHATYGLTYNATDGVIDGFDGKRQSSAWKDSIYGAGYQAGYQVGTKLRARWIGEPGPSAPQEIGLPAESDSPPS